MAYIPYEFVTHVRKVKSLYKRVLRDIMNWQDELHDQRIQMVLMRQKFEENRHVKDPIKAKQLLDKGERLYDYIRHPEPIIFPESVGGSKYEKRDFENQPDWLLDYWHPLERKMYPDYFAKREERKKEFVEWYDKTYGKPKWEEVE